MRGDGPQLVSQEMLADMWSSGELGRAWDAAEIALPDEWAIRIMTCNCDPDDRGRWKVSAGPDLGPLADPVVYVEDTPAAALRALAAKLRERAG